MSEFIEEAKRIAKVKASELRHRECVRLLVDYVNSLPTDDGKSYGEIMDETGMSSSEVCEARLRVEVYDGDDDGLCKLRPYSADGSRRG